MSIRDAATYKARKEAFVSNLSGGSLIDINLVTLVAPAGILLWTALQKRQSLFAPYDALAVVVDFLLNICAILFAFTAYSSAPVLLNVFLVIPATFLLLPLLPATTKDSGRKQKQAHSTSKASTHESVRKIPNRPFLTNYRGAMMIATCVAILAVDFPIFPRRFAKVETWGTSIMDLGVGSFVFSAGVVSARSLLGGGGPSQSRPVLYQRLFASFRHAVPLFILGLIRLYSVKGLDYAEHVTEYGVHWNFFFTLGLLPPFVELADTLTHFVFASYDILAIFVAIVYEIVLNSTSLLSYILISARGPSLLSKNREGVFSFIGYLAIFLAGRSTGTHILPLQKQPSNAKVFDAVSFTRQERLQVLKNLSIQLAIYLPLFIFCTSFYTGNLQVSRRLANAPYVFWVAAFNNAQITLFGLVEHFGPNFTHWQGPPPTNSKSAQMTEPGLKPEASASKIMQAYNKNGLAIFLVANLLTGCVNLTINTLDMSNAAAMGVLIGYTAILTGFALALDYSGIRVKL